MQTNKKKGLTVKDLVTIGIFSALFLVFALVGGIFFAPNPVLTFYMPVGSALLCGPIYLLMMAKVKKRFTATILGVIMCIIWFVTGMHWAMALGYLVMGTIIGQVVDILTASELSRPETDMKAPESRNIELKDVHFGYSDEEILHGVNLTFQEGTVNALVGPSGSGKSTIAKLIASFWDVGNGSITVGGTDIRNISSEHYNSLIAYVSQDNFLFDTTVRENIRMGKQDATDTEVEQAAKDCGCYDFIMGLEEGFETQVGGGGGHLSGGERQRISIARAMLKDAPIVILDEATAYTDPENEAVIQESVARLVHGKTLIVIAHRLSTIVDADQIIVVNNGCIEAVGTQDELLKSCLLYQKLWNAHIASRDTAKGGSENA